ncbi:hypothetical protein IED13_10630 [Bosea sp. SSUT16]|uniref:Uncharacterized protein n=2 Tax=Bosea spartocytisi TaxID=2773451 RepID=A0A927E7F3_9HYPH|nr:hypothetical protein [Bosea spartocytisi]
MGSRAHKSGMVLNEADAAIAKAMLARGDRQHDIAAWFGVNGGRIAEIATGHTFHWVEPYTGELPPPGPYPRGRDAVAALEALAVAEQALHAAREAVLQHQ